MIRTGRHKLARWLTAAARRIDAAPGEADLLSSHADDVRRSTQRHDMATDSDERYFAEQYMSWILQFWTDVLQQSPRVLDIGCGQGRLSLPLAEAAPTGHVTGIDLSGSAVDTASRYAAVARIGNVEFAACDALHYVEAQDDGSFDLILMTEVTFFLPTYKQVLREAARLLRPGGRIAISFRSQYFDLLHLIQHRRWEAVELVQNMREGVWDDSWFSWHTPEDIEELVYSLGLKKSAIIGIGPFSGIEGDPLSHVARPSILWPEERERLFAVEKGLAEQYSWAGRYIMAFCENPRLAVE
jgi:2-polyprenyl-3-methyl-5-hydroxy-6-metoxy-1,4-benzoquinol methylase